MRIFTDIEMEARPPRWENEFPLAKAEPLPLEDFPIIDDFEIVLERNKGTSTGYDLIFSSEKRGYIANVLWNHAELDLYRPSFSAVFPKGYTDFEQGWEIEIFNQAEFIYVLESDFDHPEAGYHRWFRVPEEHYQMECEAAMEASRQIVYL